MARTHFPHSDPVGARLLLQETRPGTVEEIPWTIVGVIGDERLTPFDDRREQPAVYVSIDQSPSSFAGLVVRTLSPPEQLRDGLRRAVAAFDKDQALWDVKTGDELRAEATGLDRLRAAYVALFAALAVLLAAVGVYGIFSFTVTQHTREIGIRAALGAGRRDLLWLILRRQLLLTAAGLGVGLLGIFPADRLMGHLLYGVRVSDPWTVAAAAVLLTAIAIGASWIPARRATRVHPLIALRAE
jgi:predicted lysophospholipase L1 biosynthesis ABC-type transport system permease subunit